jgi:hypothetical protein
VRFTGRSGRRLPFGLELTDDVGNELRLREVDGVPFRRHDRKPAARE